MKFTLDRDALLIAMTRASNIVAKRNTIEILSHVLLDARDDILTINATDLDLQAVVTAPARVMTAGRATVPAASLLDIAKSTAEGAEIAIELTGSRVEVRAGRAKWRLPFLPAGDFPDFKTETPEWSATLPAEALADVIGRVAWAISTDAGKQFLGGARLQVADGLLWAFASNGKDAIYATTPCAAADFAGVTVPLRACQEIVRLCAGQEEATLSLGAVQAGLDVSGASLASKVIDAAFPDLSIHKIVAMERTHSFCVDRHALNRAIRRALIGGDVGVKIEIEAALLIAHGRSHHSEGVDEIEIDYEGASAEFALVASTASDMLGAMKGDRVTISFSNGELVPLLIRVEGDASVVCTSALAWVA